MPHTLGVALAALALTLTGWTATTDSPDRTTTVSTPTPTPSQTLTCPPALPVTATVTEATDTSLTFSYSMLLTPPCGYDPPITISLFTSLDDANQWHNPAAEVTSGPERYGEVLISGLAPGTAYWFRLSAGGTRILYGTNGPVRTSPQALCAAAATIDSAWGGGFVTTVTVRNTGAEPLTGWRVTWRWTGDEHIQSLWGGVADDQSPDVTVSNATYNGNLAPGGSTTFGLLATTSTVPAGITLACSP